MQQQDMYILDQKKKKKVIRFSDTFFKKKKDACRWLFIFYFIFRLGTFLDIWVYLAKQNGDRKYLKSIYLQV